MKSGLVKGNRHRETEHRRPGYQHGTRGRASAESQCETRCPASQSLLLQACFGSSDGRVGEMKDFYCGYVAAGLAVAVIAVLACIVIL